MLTNLRSGKEHKFWSKKPFLHFIPFYFSPRKVISPQENFMQIKDLCTPYKKVFFSHNCFKCECAGTVLKPTADGDMSPFPSRTCPLRKDKLKYKYLRVTWGFFLPHPVPPTSLPELACLCHHKNNPTSSSYYNWIFTHQPLQLHCFSSMRKGISYILFIPTMYHSLRLLIGACGIFAEWGWIECNSEKKNSFNKTKNQRAPIKRQKYTFGSRLGWGRG